MTDIVKLTPEDAGCWVDGHWGQYAVAHMVNRAEELGYGSQNLPGMSQVIDIADRHIASIGPSDAPGITDDEHEALIEASDEVEDWLNHNVTPKGYSFGWHDGEFFLWSTGTWEEDC